MVLPNIAPPIGPPGKNNPVNNPVPPPNMVVPAPTKAPAVSRGIFFCIVCLISLKDFVCSFSFPSSISLPNKRFEKL